jgi:leader peptidase (prepilin peptidase)/N-methyltransferase
MFESLAGHPLAAAAVSGLFGLVVGSFLNVVILRLPRRLVHAWRDEAREVLELAAPPATEATPPDLVFARSHCPSCGHRLHAWENIPLVSYALLRGRCRACGVRISWQYPVVELITGILTAIVVWRFGLTPPAAAALVATWSLIALTGIDMRTQLLPDQITLPLLWLGLLSSVASLFVAPGEAILGAAVGYLALWSVYWAFKLLTGKEGMGYGDFKLLAALGAFCGPMGILPIVLLSSLVGAVVGAAWLAAMGRDRSVPIPFGPFLAAGGWLQLVYGPSILDAYNRLTGV